MFNGHFKIGSKIHIEQFYYAKRMFQKSFYAHRFAFLAADYIITQLSSAISSDNEGIKRLTVLGYGQYSELLVACVESILNLRREELGFRKVGDSINHNMVSDDEEVKPLKGEDIYENVIVIIPISTTFSTSVKIEKSLQTRPDNTRNLLQPFISIFVVTDGNIDDEKRIEEFNENLKIGNTEDPFVYFHWNRINNKEREIVIETRQKSTSTDLILSKPPDFRRQKYFMSINSKWYQVNNCPLCFPDDFRKERPLILTDRISITPLLVFDNPIYNIRRNAIRSIDSPVISQASHRYQHSTRGDKEGSHYLHYITPYKFYLENEKKIDRWINKVQKHLFNTESPSSYYSSIYSEPVVIISPERYSNSFFIQSINDKLFNKNCNIIRYDINGDFVENDKRFFRNEILNAGFVFFIDDIINSGNTFFTVNSFVKSIRNYDEHFSCRGVDGVFALIDRTDEQAYNEILRELLETGNSVKVRRGGHLTFPGSQIPEHNTFLPENRFFSFFDLKVPTHDKTSKDCPLCEAQEKFIKLHYKSSMDTLRYYFLENKIRLNVVDAERDHQIDGGGGMGRDKFDLSVEVFGEFYSQPFPWNSLDSTVIEKWRQWDVDHKPLSKYVEKLYLVHELHRSFEKNEDGAYRLLRNILNNENVEEVFSEARTNLDEVVMSLIQTDLFSKHFSKGSDPTYIEELRDNLIKVLTTNPFIKYRKIKNHVFYWVNCELDKVLSSIISSRQRTYATFRSVKFFLRRSGLLKSNYIVRQENLLKLENVFLLIKDIQGQINEAKRKCADEELNLHQKNENFEKKSKRNIQSKLALKTDSPLLNEVVSEGDEVESIQKALLFLDKHKRQLDVKLKSLQDFEYFIVAVVKELISDNDSVAIALETSLRNIEENIACDEAKGIKRDEDFKHLIRLLRLENTLIVEKFFQDALDNGLFNMIRDNEMSTQFADEQTIINNWIDYFKNNSTDYKIQPLIEYLKASTGISNESELWTNSEFLESFITTCYLRLYISSNTREYFEEKHSIERQVETILRNTCRILGLDTSGQDSEGGAFLTINHRLQNKEQPLSAKDTFTFSSTGLKCFNDTDIDDRSLTLQVMNGVTGREGGYPWTTLEVRNVNGRWLTNRESLWRLRKRGGFGETGSEYNLSEKFTEELLADSCNNFLFFRVSVMDEVIAERGGSKISHNCLGVICIYNSSLNFYSANQVKYMYLLRNSLQQYFMRASDNDSFRAYVEEKRRVKLTSNLEHGVLDSLKKMSEITEDIYNYANSDQDRAKQRLTQFQLLYDIISHKPKFVKIFEDISMHEKSSPMEFFGKHLEELREITTDDILEDFLTTCNLVYGDKSVGRDTLFEICPISVQKGLKLYFYRSVIRVIMLEVVKNAKKNKRKVKTCPVSRIGLEFRCSSQGEYALTISDNGKLLSGTAKDLMNRRGYLLNLHGLNLVSNLLTALGNPTPSFEIESRELFSDIEGKKVQEKCLCVKIVLKSIEGCN